MTCEEFHALKGQGLGVLTASLALAATRHMHACPACKKLADDCLAEKSPEALAVIDAAVPIIAATITDHITTDPELL